MANTHNVEVNVHINSPDQPPASNPGFGATAPSNSGRILSGYFCATCPSNPDPANLVNNINSAYNVVNFSFITHNADGSLNNEFDAPSKGFVLSKSIVESLQSQGRKVFISFGGGAASALNGDSPQSFIDNLAANILTIVNQYGFDGFDWDVEHFSGSLTGYINIMDSVNAKLKQGKPDLLLSAAPQLPHLYPDLLQVSPGWNIYAPMASTQGSKLLMAWMQVQLYNQWEIADSYYVPYVKALIAGFKPVKTQGGTVTYDTSLTQDQIVLGFPASTQAAGNGYRDPSQIVGWVQQLENEGISIRGIMTWSIGWDQQNNWSFANGLAPIL